MSKFKTIRSLNEPIISMIEYKGDIFIASGQRVWRKQVGAEIFKPMEFFVEKEYALKEKLNER